MRGRPALLAAVVLTLAGCATPKASPDPTRAVTGTRCSAPAPTTAAGYAAMFARLPQTEWAAGDDGISIPFGKTSIWLFGDTMSARPQGFVHSTAIVQTDGCLHVSRAGAQLLPNDDAHHIYWIESARPVDRAHIAVIARAVVLTGTCLWCFHDGGFDRTALMSVSAGGDLTFLRWTAKAHTPPPDPGPLLDCEAPAPALPGHFCYARSVHSELRLAGGRVLVTTAQGWDDGRLHPFTDYRLIFTAEPHPRDGRMLPSTPA